MTWDYNKSEAEKQATADPLWKYEHMLQFGVGDERISCDEIRKVLNHLHISDDRRAFLELLIWNKPF